MRSISHLLTLHWLVAWGLSLDDPNSADKGAERPWGIPAAPPSGTSPGALDQIEAVRYPRDRAEMIIGESSEEAKPTFKISSIAVEAGDPTHDSSGERRHAAMDIRR